MRPQQADIRRIRIVIVDNHPVFLQGLRQLLEIEQDFLVVGQADGGVQALDLIVKEQPDILLLDHSMSPMSGLEVLGHLSKIDTKVKVILLTGGVDSGNLALAIQLGIRGVVLKESATETLFSAIRAVSAGECWMVFEKVSHLGGATAAGRSAPSLDEQALRKEFGLTFRELEFIKAVLGGKSNKEIATRFSTSESTVKRQLAHLYRKVGISTRLDLLLVINKRRKH